MMFLKPKILAGATAFCLTTASVQAGSLINVNIGGNGDLEVESQLVGPAGGLGTTWNQFLQDSTSTLDTSTGTDTTIEYDITYSLGTNETPEPGLVMLVGGVSDFGRGPGTLTITGLDAGLYDIWLTSYREKAGVEYYIGDWTTSNTTSTVGAQEIDNLGQNMGNGDTFVEGVNYVKFENVVVDSSGQAVFFATPDTNYRLGLNGFQIEVVPEPSSVALGLMGLGALMARRRRD